MQLLTICFPTEGVGHLITAELPVKVSNPATMIIPNNTIQNMHIFLRLRSSANILGSLY